MSTKAFQARVICDEETRAKLWKLTETFNERVRFILLKMLEMRAGRAGPALKAVFEAIGSSQNAIAKMEAIGGTQWKTRKLDSPDGESFGRIRTDLDAVVQRLGGWIDTRPMEWSEHLRNDASLLQWRTKDVVFVDLSAEELARIEKQKNPVTGRKKPSRTQVGKKRIEWQAIAARLLKKKNEELNALDRTRREFLWAEEAQAVREAPERFFDKVRDLPNVANAFKRKVYEGAFAIIDSHNEKLKDWRRRHVEWMKEKLKFEKEHKQYMAIRAKFDQFERHVGGVASKRRRRWHHYLAFLRQNPGLASWRGKPAVVNAIPEEGLRRISKARRNKRSSVEAEEFFTTNPELKAIDEVHGRYEEEFVRRGVARRFLDGFARPPTLTLPQVSLHRGAASHPTWYTFQKDVAYKDLDFTKSGDVVEGTVKVMLPFKNDAGKYEWPQIHFRGTPRLATLHRATPDKLVVQGMGKSAKKFTWRYFDPHSRDADGRPAEIKGIKLLFRPTKPNGIPYLVFTVALADKAISTRVATLKAKSARIPEGMVSCAADLVMRHPHLAAASIAVAVKTKDGGIVPKIVRSGFIRASEFEQSGRHQGRMSYGPSLKHQAIQKQKIRSLRKGSRAVKGSTRNRSFQQHVTNMGEDACRKTARKLVSFAKTAWPGSAAEVLAVENLKALRADARRERGLNAALINWRRGHTAKWTKLFAETDGLLFREEKAYWTSQVCSRCLRLGRRYTPCRNEETRVVEPRFGTVESLFACPTPGCQIDVNADLNASINLHHVLYGTFPKVKKTGDAVVIEGLRTTYGDIEQAVLARLRREAKWLKDSAGDEAVASRQVVGLVF